MKPTFKTLAILTIISIVLLVPYIVSDAYLALLRDRIFNLYLILQGDIYKQITGFVGLGFFFIEMALILRKRGRKWKIKIPGSVLFWRQLHIFLGVAFLGVILIHTGGSMGHHFNFYFLLTFIAVSLSALLGVAVETRILATPQQKFSLSPINQKSIKALFPVIAKAPLIRHLRSVWLGLHIVLVGGFSVLLGFHIFLAYYFQ